MRLASFNMRGGGTQLHWGTLIDAAEPDIFFAQESKDPHGFPDELFQAVDYGQAVWAPVGHGKWGAAILVPSGVVERVDVPDFEGWIVGGRVNLSGAVFNCFSIHVPRSAGTYVQSAHQVLDSLAPLLDGVPTILAGDWNLTVGPRRDDEERRNRPGELELLDRLRTEFGVVSAWPAANPDAPLVQTLRWTNNPTVPYHCDGIFVPTEWAECLLEVSVLDGDRWERISDHNPVVAALDWRRIHGDG